MTRIVLYRIIDRPDQRYDLTATLTLDKTFTRESLASMAEVNAALDLLRFIMAACGVELVQDPAVGAVVA